MYILTENTDVKLEEEMSGPLISNTNGADGFFYQVHRNL